MLLEGIPSLSLKVFFSQPGPGFFGVIIIIIIIIIIIHSLELFT